MNTQINAWFEKVETILVREYGLGMHALPQYKWSDAWKRGLEPKRAVAAFAEAYPTYSRMYRAC